MKCEKRNIYIDKRQLYLEIKTGVKDGREE